MSSKSEDAKALAGDILAPETVGAWLKRNPGFLNDNPDVLAALLPPDMDHGEGVLDMQRFMLQRLQRELASMTAREQTLLRSAKVNADIQAKIHSAVRALLDADSLEALLGIVTGKLPGLFDVAATALCIERDTALPEEAEKMGVILLPEGALTEILTEDRTVVLRANIEGDERIFGKKAAQVRSTALLKLDLGDRTALLALGARVPDGFDPRQGTELLSFFAHALQTCLRRWLATAR
tara:strand:+ start:654 stop:1367 length:714 start_codon:yes stop_codon:yes gene_type:complete